MSAAQPLLIFDLDGTISDPTVGIGRSMNYAIDAFG
jgi:phosphoglycolate phosphatase-like HAD superfamily hydrolase